MDIDYGFLCKRRIFSDILFENLCGRICLGGSWFACVGADDCNLLFSLPLLSSSFLINGKAVFLFAHGCSP